MSYTSFDFSESLFRVSDRLAREDIVECVAAHGWSGTYAEWTGGFVLRLKDGYAYLSGWCDTTGWGCQDGVDLVIQSEPFDLATLRGPFDVLVSDWDLSPVDLNRYLRGEIEDFC